MMGNGMSSLPAGGGMDGPSSIRARRARLQSMLGGAPPAPPPKPGGPRPFNDPGGASPPILNMPTPPLGPSTFEDPNYPGGGQGADKPNTMDTLDFQQGQDAYLKGAPQNLGGVILGPGGMYSGPGGSSGGGMAGVYGDILAQLNGGGMGAGGPMIDPGPAGGAIGPMPDAPGSGGPSVGPQYDWMSSFLGGGDPGGGVPYGNDSMPQAIPGPGPMPMQKPPILPGPTGKPPGVNTQHPLNKPPRRGPGGNVGQKPPTPAARPDDKRKPFKRPVQRIHA